MSKLNLPISNIDILKLEKNLPLKYFNVGIHIIFRINGDLGQQIEYTKMITYKRNQSWLSGQIPLVLQDLSSLENKLIQKINVFMTIVMLPGGQYAEKGLVLNLPAEIQHLVSQLPLLPNDVPYCPQGVV